LEDVHTEVKEMFLNNKFFGISNVKDKVFKAKPETVKWIPTDENTPREVQALMVLYKVMILDKIEKIIINKSVKNTRLLVYQSNNIPNLNEILKIVLCFF
jgi:hypothetical protein